MRIGVLGGTFDPIHCGHLIVAELCRESMGLDRVHYIPAASPPHKQGHVISPARNRLEMVRLAISGQSAFHLDLREQHRAGPSFTVQTLNELRNEYPDADLYFLMGADSLRDFLTWKDPDEIARLATLVVCNRPGVASPSTEQVLAWVGPDIASRVHTVQIPGLDLSGTELRARIAANRTIRFLVPRAVEVYISEHGLYRS
jgi:nicotinate-nucleotide adenylyltransferase